MDLSNENIIHIKKDNIEYLQFKKLLEFDNLVNCYTLSVKDIDFTRVDLIEEKRELLNKNYDYLCSALNIDKKFIIRPYQTHSDNIAVIRKEENITENENLEINDKFNGIDGIITNKPGINLMLTFADCTPIFLYDKVNNVIGNIHSGWKGTLQKIGQKAVYKMVKEFGSNPKDIIACIGPCIKKCHFEVGEDVKNLFEKEFSYLNRINDIIEKSKEKEGKFFIDTDLINKLILEEAGLSKENIINSNICTVCKKDYMHSYRGSDNKDGRNISLFGIKI